MDDSCAVCAENLDWVAYGSCGHREVCSTCVVRLRFIFNDRHCCICKTECPIVFVTKALGDYTKTITDFSTFPSTTKEGQVGSYWYHEETKAFFDDSDQYTRIKTMCKLSCSSCDNNNKTTSPPRIRFKSVEQLKNHLNHQHNLHMCSLCLIGRKVFICEQKLFTKKQLNQHITSGDSKVDGNENERGGFTGHPKCEFCKIPFYGGNELYTHMSREHYTCHICQRLKPGQYEYYGNYDDLEVHFRNEHFLCEDESCLSKKFIVFQIESDLKRHNVTDHGSRMSRSQRNASLQTQASFQYCGRSRSSHREPNLAISESQAINNGDTLLQPVGSSGSSRLGLVESSFPPLTSQPNRSHSRFVQNSESLRHQTNRNATSGSSRDWPALNRGSTTQSSTSSLSSINAKRNNNNNHHSSSSTSVTKSVTQPSPSVSALQNRRSLLSSSSPSTGVSDNKSLVETIRASLGNDERLFAAFKDTSGKYRHGLIDARTYLEHVKGFGLSHLVLDMAKLCPDTKKQKELIDTHNAIAQSPKEKAVKDKGKTKVTDSSSSSAKQQCKKKTSKFLRARGLGGEKSEPELESKNENNSKSRNQNFNTGGSMPLRGAWRRGSSKLFL